MNSLQLKKLAATAIAAATMFAATANVSQAAALGPTSFNVTAALTSICTTAAIPDLVFGSYTAFQAAALSAAASTFAITCTRGLAAPSFAFDGGAYGLITGLNYSVSASSAIGTAGAAPTAIAGSLGTPDSINVTINGSVLGGQAGTDSGGVAQLAVRTLTITY